MVNKALGVPQEVREMEGFLVQASAFCGVSRCYHGWFPLKVVAGSTWSGTR